MTDRYANMPLYGIYVMSVKMDYNASNQLVPVATIYVNGVYVTTLDAIPGTDKIMTKESTFAFGAGQLTGGSDFGVWANYDDIRYYDKALNADEATAVSGELIELAPAPETVDPGDFTFADDEEDEDTTTAPSGNNDTTTASNDTTAAAGDDTAADDHEDERQP